MIILINCLLTLSCSQKQHEKSTKQPNSSEEAVCACAEEIFRAPSDYKDSMVIITSGNRDKFYITLSIGEIVELMGTEYQYCSVTGGNKHYSRRQGFILPKNRTISDQIIGDSVKKSFYIQVYKKSVKQNIYRVYINDTGWADKDVVDIEYVYKDS